MALRYKLTRMKIKCISEKANNTMGGDGTAEFLVLG